MCCDVSSRLEKLAAEQPKKSRNGKLKCVEEFSIAPHTRARQLALEIQHIYGNSSVKTSPERLLHSKMSTASERASSRPTDTDATRPRSLIDSMDDMCDGHTF